MGKSKRKHLEQQEWDAWEHFEEESHFTSMKPKVKKMKKDKPSFDKKRK